jgi:hypothetical protein
MKKEAVSETSVNIYHTIRHHIPEDINFHSIFPLRELH